MESYSNTALMLDRLASNSTAGCSRPAGGFPSFLETRLQPRKRKLGGRGLQACSSAECPIFGNLNFASKAFCSQALADFGRGAHSCKRLKRTLVHSTLQRADYEIYRDIPHEEITEDFLWERLRPLLGYLSEEDVTKVREALSLAADAHAGQMRKSGEPFITHPLEVTRLLAELHMDKESLIAGLLHDTVEDNPAQITFEEIGVWFGQAVRTIVEGETKFSKIGQLSSDLASNADIKARDLQHLFLAMTKEVRIIVVKLADRLHNMRTLNSMPPLKQRKIAEETLQVFAPLARLLGLYSIKEELEELAFSYSKPDEYVQLRRRLDQLAAEQEPAVLQAKKALEDMLSTDVYLLQRATLVKIVPAQKSVYSVYRKLEESKRCIDDVTEVAQLCVVIQPKEDQDTYLYGTGSQLCYHVMGLVHTKWAPIPGSIKDYIATPKRNGYQSLHTTVLPLGSTQLFPLEVQIRTNKMQDLAEFGIAGEKWVATGAHSHRGGTADLDQEFERTAGRPGRAPGSMVGDLLKMLPRLMGLSQDLANDSAAVPVNGHARSGQGRTPINGKPVPAAVRLNGASPVANGHASLKAKPMGVTIKQNASRLDRDVLKRREHWLKSIIEWQKEFVDSLTAREFVDGITGDLLGRGVFVFTPNGDLMRLPKDSTAVDFAYHVHTDVGNQMVGAKVNGKLVNPDHHLVNAEVVEILTYNGPPTSLSVARHHEWAKWARSKTARHKLAKFLKDNARLLPEHLKSVPSGLSDRGSESSEDEASVQPEGTVWLDVEGEEGPGLLAELAKIIAKHGHDVKTYSGFVNRSSGTLQMRFEVCCLRGQCEAMCAEIGSAPCVRSWKLDASLEFRRQLA